MKEVTEKAAEDMSKTQERLLTNQESLAERQSVIGGLLQNNMEDILKEKKLIAAKHVQVEEYTKMINDQLGKSFLSLLHVNVEKQKIMKNNKGCKRLGKLLIKTLIDAA